ncbi:fido domain-containing protein [Mycena epipterygia]|nr:fido domain-containing protein [Mycena epipterygia]
MASVARGDASLDEKLIFDLHELVQRQSRFETLSYDDTASIVVKRTGALRGELCYTTLHSDDSAVVEFAPADALPSLFPNMLADFNDTAGSQGKEWSPLHAAAYMHHVFVSIHPFSDGNGRLGRIIASLPLLRTGAPPILITRALRTRYLDAIQSVRETSDLSALVDVFADGMAEGLEFVESLPELGDDRKI